MALRRAARAAALAACLAGAGPSAADDALAAPLGMADDASVAGRLAAPGPSGVEVLDVDLTDPARSRVVPVRLRVPQPCTAGRPRPLVLFSHGLGGSRAGGAAWGAHWASHGFAVAHLQHPGSDESLWRDRPGGLTPEALRPGMTPAQYVARIRDVPAALDAIAALAAARPSLACIDASRAGLAGHSFGALTTQALAGQSLPRPGQGASGPWAREPRVVAAIAFSPSMRDGSPAARASLATVSVPFLAVTGSLDGDVLGTGVSAASRRAVYDALPPPDRWLLWLDGADHGVFAGAAPRARTAGRADDAAVQRTVRAVSLAFWQATLGEDSASRAWLDGDGPRSMLGPADAWSAR